MCKLYLIQKEGKWYGVFTSPEGSCRRTNYSKAILTMTFKAMAREQYKCKLEVIDLEGK